MDTNNLSSAQENLQNNLESVKKELLKKPNVLAVGIGIKETGKEFTSEISYRVYVKEKIDPSTLSKEDAIPEAIGSIKTDVLEPLEIFDDSNVCGDERLTLSKHRPLQAGIAVSTDKTSVGTLGWFGKLDVDDTPVLLTNKHVLYDSVSEVKTEKLKTAQPKIGEVTKCCCCECGSDNVIGEAIIGIKNTSPLASSSVDCAIAKINTEHASNISLNITNASTTQVLTVSGTAQAVVGETVRKIGARSGFTTGTVIHVGDLAAAPSDPGGGTIAVRTGQVLVIPVATETYQVKEGVCKFAFSNSGDSGAVILNSSNKIIALNYAGNRTAYSVGLTVANNISNVLTAFSDNGFPITLSVSPAGGGDSDIVGTHEHSVLARETKNIFEQIRDVNRDSLLYQLYERHFKEIMELINHSRPVTIAWQRNQGPAFVAAVGRAARVEHYEVPCQINEKSRQELLEAMRQALMDNGSEKLKRDILLYEERLIPCLLQATSVEEFAVALLEAKLLDRLPAFTNSEISA